MKKTLINVEIYQSNANAILVEGNKISLVSTSEEVLKHVDENDEVIDLKGMFVMPGFVDSHMHLLELGFYLSCVQLASCTSLQEMKERFIAKLKTIKDGEWLIARGYNEENFVDEKQKPTKEFLDAISTDVPIAVTRACGHSMSCNTKALQLAGITENSSIEGGTIHYEDGIVEETAINLVHEAWPKPDTQKLQEYIFKGIDCCNKYGVTTVGSDDFLSVTDSYPDVLDAFEKLSYQEKMNVRVNEQCEFNDVQEFSKFLDEGYTFDVGNDFFRIGPLKLVTDGSLGARSAAMTQPYNDAPDKTGIMNYTVDEMRTFVELANKFNMPTIAHAIGDRAVDDVLKAYEGNVYAGNPLHHGLVHCQIMRKDQIQKICEEKLSCYFQSLFIDADAPVVEKRVGETLAQTSYPYRTFVENTLASNGSDAPVEMPNALYGIELAVTRKSGTSLMNQQECLTITQAIDSYTINGAKQLFMDDRIGKIQEGYYADLVVVDTNITKQEPQKIHEAKIMMTMMNGEVVFER